MTSKRGITKCDKCGRAVPVELKDNTYSWYCPDCDLGCGGGAGSVKPKPVDYIFDYVSKPQRAIGGWDEKK